MDVSDQSDFIGTPASWSGATDSTFFLVHHGLWRIYCYWFLR